jgi:hypothetical protein
MPFRSFALAAASLLFAALNAPASPAEPCCGPITTDGRRLTALLDSTGVDHLWLSGHHIVWDTGEPDQNRPDGLEEATHCSAFVGAIARRLGIYVLRPPEHPQELLASAQVRWMASDGAKFGWRVLDGAGEAQGRANQGDLVLEAFENPNPHRPGHIAIVRPSEKTRAELDRDGPEETQAGSFNALDTTTRLGFRNHRGAWRRGDAGSLRYYAHAIDWSAS